MRRTQMYLTEEQRKRLAQRAKVAGTSEAAVIRQILDEALGIEYNTDDLPAAIDAAAGICRDYPDWREWLADVRGTRGADARLTKLGL